MKGIVQVYTGNGKGKTTAAFGQAMRAIGHGLNVLIIQFLKCGKYGEVKAITNAKFQISNDKSIPNKQISNIQIEQFGTGEFVDPKKLTKIDFELARKGLERAKEAIKSRECDLIILDEINVAIKFGLITLDRVLDLIKNKPKNLELILTGRWADKKIIDAADLVTEMKEIKHPFQKGTRAEKGREY